MKLFFIVLSENHELNSINLFFIRLTRRIPKITQIIIDMPNYFFLNVFTLLKTLANNKCYLS